MKLTVHLKGQKMLGDNIRRKLYDIDMRFAVIKEDWNNHKLSPYGFFAIVVEVDNLTAHTLVRPTEDELERREYARG